MMANNNPVEKKIEDWACGELRKSGCMPLKGIQDNSNDWPDRLVLCPDSHYFWIEFKRLGEHPRPAHHLNTRS